MSESSLASAPGEIVEITVNLPSWLDDAAAAQGIDLAQTLQDALKERLRLP